MESKMTELKRLKAIRDGLIIQKKALKRAIWMLVKLEEEVGEKSVDIRWTIMHHSLTIEMLNEKIQILLNRIRRIEENGEQEVRNDEPVRIRGMRA